MICERCGYVFRAEDAAVSLFDRRAIVEHIRNFAALTVCVRCGHMKHVEQRGHDIRRYKATCKEVQRVREAIEGEIVSPQRRPDSVVYGIGWYLK